MQKKKTKIWLKLKQHNLSRRPRGGGVEGRSWGTENGVLLASPTGTNPLPPLRPLGSPDFLLQMFIKVCCSQKRKSCSTPCCEEGGTRHEKGNQNKKDRHHQKLDTP